MLKPLVLALATAAAAFGANAAHAGGVSWSVAIDTPVVGTVISNAPPAYSPGYIVQDLGYAPGYQIERGYAPGYQVERGDQVDRGYAPGYPVDRAYRPGYHAVPAYGQPHRAVPAPVVYVRPAPVYVEAPLPIYHPYWVDHHRRVIVVPPHRWHHDEARNHRGHRRD